MHLDALLDKVGDRARDDVRLVVRRHHRDDSHGATRAATGETAASRSSFITFVKTAGEAVFLDPLERGGAEPAPQRVVLQKRGAGLGEVERLVRHERLDAVSPAELPGRKRGAHDRNAAGRGLQALERHAGAEAHRRDEDTRGGIQRRQVVERAALDDAGARQARRRERSD